MQTIEAKQDEYARLIKACDEKGCLEYIANDDDFHNTKYRGMLHLACEYRLNKVAIALIDRKCDLKYQNSYGVTALMLARYNNLEDVVAHIINNSTDTKTRGTCYGTTEMMMLQHP
ncbi:MAG: hypothetical protein Faunusvirus13_6 [Faunusvirus sp.]|jgi:ankyrin repeat protein|uniref:Uncharacterized protein n=1 Tax=Faunusvirus sp. TaxID=2487766 RepID=A0A3G5A0P8_9VIRU|nr:MAG: hypothetical protein Faunusvirus13_6 [Faunusvirus sp.]